MKYLSAFYYMIFSFGLAPFSISGNKKKKFDGFIKLIPTYSVFILYSFCIGSLFWQNKGMSEIVYTANWIQVRSSIFE